MPNEPGDMITTLFSKLIDRIKSNRPMRSDDRPVTSGFVYSQLVLGMPIDPRDFTNPYSPMGGTALQETVEKVNAALADPAAAANAEVKEIQRSMRTAFNTAALVNNLIQVSKDDAYLEYPQGRSISEAYNGIINGMQPLATAEQPAEIKERIDKARRLLWNIDSDGLATTETPLYQQYLANAQAYADAKGAFEDARVASLATPQTAASWPMRQTSYLNKVKQARDRLITSGADRVEAALATLGSVGVNIDAALIAKSRAVFDAWSLGLAGVPVTVPFSYIQPTGWCDPERQVGFQKLVVERNSSSSSSESSSNSNSWSNWSSRYKNASGGGMVGFGPFFATGGGSSSSSSSNSAGGAGSSGTTQFRNDAKNLSIELEYGLCTIYRPWFLGDLFYLRNWYLDGNKKNTISDGTINAQAGDINKLMPMVPRQFLVIRNVKIKSTDWGQDGNTIRQAYAEHKQAAASSSGSASGGGGFSLGFITVGGRGGSSWGSAGGSASGFSNESASGRVSYTFENNELHIPGTQIIGWLSEIVPACPAGDAPNAPTT